jgi:hypothetical protein
MFTVVHSVSLSLVVAFAALQQTKLSWSALDTPENAIRINRNQTAYKSTCGRLAAFL